MNVGMKLENISLSRLLSLGLNFFFFFFRVRKGGKEKKRLELFFFRQKKKKKKKTLLEKGISFLEDPPDIGVLSAQLANFSLKKIDSPPSTCRETKHHSGREENINRRCCMAATLAA